MTTTTNNDSAPKADSQGNAFYPASPPMRRPNLSFLYRLECTISPEEIELGPAHGSGVVRNIFMVTGGTFKGPELEGTVLPLGAADWATVVEGTHSMTLDARYTGKTTDGEYIYFQAHGLYQPGPGTDYARRVERDPRLRPPSTVSQDDVEFFSHLRIEAGPGKYNWLNGLVCVGVMTCEDDRIIIDCYHLTNFPGVKPESVMARKIA